MNIEISEDDSDVYITLSNLSPHNIYTSGSEDITQDFDEYVLHFGSLTIEKLSSLHVKQLAIVLIDHLKSNGHDFLAKGEH